MGASRPVVLALALLGAASLALSHRVLSDPTTAAALKGEEQRDPQLVSRGRALGQLNTAPPKVYYKRGVVPAQPALVRTEDAGVNSAQGNSRAALQQMQDPLYTWPAAVAGPVVYHGGQLLTSPITVHVVYYGNWPANSGQSVIEGFIKSLSSSAADSLGPSAKNWWGILSDYTDNSGTMVSQQVSLGKTVAVGGAYSTQLSDGMNGGNSDIAAIVADQITANKLPLDPNAVYAFISSPDVHVGDPDTGFCGTTGYCGFHTQTTVSGTNIQYAFVGDGSVQCPSGCGHTDQLPETPTGHKGADGLIGTLAHELAEAASNPDTQSGYWAQDQSGQTALENADLCNGDFVDSVYPDLLYNTAGTYAYNLVGLDGLKFLVQTNVDIKKQECVLQGSEGNGTTSAPSDQPPPPPDVTVGDSPPPPDVTVGDSPPPPDITVGDAPPPPDTTVGDYPPPPDTTVGDAPPPPDVTVGDAPPPPDIPANSTCTAADLQPCTSCGSPDGCLCLQGSCNPLCQVAAAANLMQNCASCGASSCVCAADGTCQPETFLQQFFGFLQGFLG